MSNRNGLVETNIPAKRGGRVYWVDGKGFGYDLLPTGYPPIITGVTKDGRFTAIIDPSNELPQDIQPDALGLTAISYLAILNILNNSIT